MAGGIRDRSAIQSDHTVLECSYPDCPFQAPFTGLPPDASRVLDPSFTAGTTIPAHLQGARFNGLPLLDLDTLQTLVGCPLSVMFALVLDSEPPTALLSCQS